MTTKRRFWYVNKKKGYLVDGRGLHQLAVGAFDNGTIGDRLVVGHMVACGEGMVSGVGMDSSMDTCSIRETADETILGDLLVKYGGGVKVNPFDGWARGVSSRITTALLAQESNRCLYKTKVFIRFNTVVTCLLFAPTPSLENIMTLLLVLLIVGAVPPLLKVADSLWPCFWFKCGFSCWWDN